MNLRVKEAAEKHFEAQAAHANANLEIYVDPDSHMAVGNHADIVTDVIKLTEQAEHAESCLNFLKGMELIEDEI